ncbi:MAG: MarR family winged helix-turn-helix transcriptional regulator [Ktedonobacterales bacterium]
MIRGLLSDLLRVGNLTLPRIGERFAAELGASLVELDLLAELAHAPDRRLRMSEISHRLTISTTSVTRVVDGLEARGYAKRVLSQGDRRVVYAELTDQGAELLERAHPVSGPALEECLGRFFTTAEMVEMRALLRKVLDEACGDSTEPAEDMESRV